MDKKYILKKLKYIEQNNDEEITRIELYAIMASLLLSKEEFKTNKEISEFLNKIEIAFKPYILKSRTILLGKIIRILEKSDINKLNLFVEIIRGKLINETDVSSNEKNKSVNKIKQSNYMNDILKKYSRNENE